MSKPYPRVIDRDRQRFALPCSACGKTAVGIVCQPDDRSGVYVSGIARQTFLGVGDPAAADRVAAWLRAGDLAALHSFIERDEREGGGLDAYCPDCDRVYCREHYQVREEWDQGFYHSAHGECPQGHRRKIDD
jgi:hypothetical protein